MVTDKAKLAQAIEHLHLANKLQQEAGIVSNDEEDVCYEVHNAIEDTIATLEEFL